MPIPRNPLSRRQVLAAAGGTGLLAAAASPAQASTTRLGGPRSGAGDGTPEQIHLTWGEDPTTSVVVSWASPDRALRPRVRIGKRVIPAEQRQYTDGLNGETVWTYHARVGGLRPGATYAYAVTADNDGDAADPFTATFQTAQAGRHPFRFTSFGDLATPNTKWVLSYGQSAYAVEAVESFQPLFHLLNGDLCYANLNPGFQPEVWRDFGNNNQSSATNRPWMPCPGNHEVEFDNGPQGYTSYLTRYTLPDNQVPGFAGRWYSFRVGSALFVSLNADDVIYQDAGAFVGGPAQLVPAASTGNPPIQPGTSLYIAGYSGGAQTRWLERTLAAARRDPSIDWIIVQTHQCALSSSATGNGSDLGIRAAWLPLFDRYEVDLVLNGHDHDYERSFPCRGFDADVGQEVATGAAVNTMRPHPVTTTDSGVFDTSQGTVHLILGCGGTSAPLDSYGLDSADGQRQAKVFTRANRPVPTSTPGVYTRPGSDAVEDAVWSARRDTSTGYGIAVFDVDPGSGPGSSGPRGSGTGGSGPGSHGGYTSIRVTHYHAVGADPVNPASGAKGAPTPDYTEFETFTLVRPRSDRGLPGRQGGAG
ncbi:MAG: metallophosphoesterase family protein [Streptosporangiaceae bacterium]|nr:metallophosphoesterase family protein [Streptosporangiaceae bacterium]